MRADMSSSQESLSHQFILAVKRGRHYDTSQNPRHSVATRMIASFADAVVDQGSVYMQLKTPEGSTASYFYDNGAPYGLRMGLAVGAAVSLVGAHMAGVPIPPPLYYSLSLGMPFLIGTNGPGEVARSRARPFYHVGLAFDIDADRHDTLATELKALSEKKSEGVYSLLLNNCSGYALRFARDHGFDVPELIWPTPRNLANKLESLKIPEPVPSP